jgi:hypothetical protein
LDLLGVAPASGGGGGWWVVPSWMHLFFPREARALLTPL